MEYPEKPDNKSCQATRIWNAVKERGGIPVEKDRLIVISDHYLTFVKDQIESISGSFSRIDVLVRYNPIAEISRILPINRLRPFRKSALVDLTGRPDNIKVHLIPVFFLPVNRSYKALGERYFQTIERYLESHGISAHLLHAHFLWPNGHVAARLREKSGIPCVVTAHGYDIYDVNTTMIIAAIHARIFTQGLLANVPMRS